MKWTQAKLNKLSREEVISILDRLDHMETIYSTISTAELKNRLLKYINRGLC